MNYLFINVTTLFDAFRSGTEEEYTELQQLLHDINSFKRDMEEVKNKEIMKKKQKQKQDREKGLQMREAPLSGMASKSFPEITFIALKINLQSLVTGIMFIALTMDVIKSSRCVCVGVEEGGALPGN